MKTLKELLINLTRCDNRDENIQYFKYCIPKGMLQSKLCKDIKNVISIPCKTKDIVGSIRAKFDKICNIISEYLSNNNKYSDEEITMLTLYLWLKLHDNITIRHYCLDIVLSNEMRELCTVDCSIYSMYVNRKFATLIYKDRTDQLLDFIVNMSEEAKKSEFVVDDENIFEL